MKSRVITLLTIVAAFLCGLAWNGSAAPPPTLDPQEVITALSDASMRSQLTDAVNAAFEDSNYPIHIPQIRVDQFEYGNRAYFVGSPVAAGLPEAPLTEQQQDEAIYLLHDVLTASGLASK